MRTQLLSVAALALLIAPGATAQRRSRDAAPPPERRDRVVSTSDTRFTPALRSGQRLSVSNIDGKVTVSQGRGQSAEIVAHKIVRRGNGDLVKAVLEQTSDGYRVCTVYLEDTRDDGGCNHRNNGHYDRREPLDVDMDYEVRLPAGVAITVNTVDGSIDARGIDTPGTFRSVDGSITFDGVAPEVLNTVDGSITATISNRDWGHSLSVRTVDGSIELTLPASMNARISGHTVDGDIDSDFPVTVVGKWGPQSFHGDMGDGRGPELDLSSVDGSIRLRSSDGVKRGTTTDAPRRRGRGGL